MARTVDPVVPGALVAVAGSYLAVRWERAARIDAQAQRLLTGWHGAASDRALAAFTDLGSIYSLAGVSCSLALAGRRRVAAEVALAGAGAWVAAQGAKPLLDRQRPYELTGAARLVAIPAGTSWPSGHAALTAAMATALWPSAHPRTRAAMALATSAVGLSRCYVGVHHLSDVVAGAGLGVLAARATGVLARRVRRR